MSDPDAATAAALSDSLADGALLGENAHATLGPPAITDAIPGVQGEGHAASAFGASAGFGPGLGAVPVDSHVGESRQGGSSQQREAGNLVAELYDVARRIAAHSAAEARAAERQRIRQHNESVHGWFCGDLETPHEHGSDYDADTCPICFPEA